jgi:hypothetical protein
MNLTGDRAGTLGIAAVHEHVHARLAERAGNRPAEAGRRSYDQGDSVLAWRAGGVCVCSCRWSETVCLGQ